MKGLLKALLVVALIANVLFISVGCSNGSTKGTYYREFGDYTSTTMYNELKRDMTLHTDGTAPGIISEGMYEINDSVITFVYINPLPDTFGGEGEERVSGTINGKTLTLNGVTYKK